jgi:hypothetical protein
MDAQTSKLGNLKAAAARNDWREAVAIAARFPRLGAIRNAVLDAHTAYTNPRFLAQLGRDPHACIEAGRSALIAAYRIEQ